MRVVSILIASVTATLSLQATAAINAPLPSNASITKGGLDWAWASACSPIGCLDGFVSPIDLSYQGTHGWRLPRRADWANAPTAADFLFAGANVPDGGADPFTGANFFNVTLGSAGACASPWFVSFAGCNYIDGDIGAIWGIPDSNYIGIETVDTWLVRGGTGVVPEPASWAMLIAGFGLVGAMMRRRRVLPA